jgi:hypothetical protein
MGAERCRLLRLAKPVFAAALGIFTLAVGAQLIPQKLPMVPGMERFDSRHFTVWALPADRRAAIELRSALEDRSGQARVFLGLPADSSGHADVYLYPDRLSFTLHRAGLWALWADTAGIVVERRGDGLLVVSPDNPGLAHGRDTVILEACAAWIRPLVAGRAAGAGPWLAEGIIGWLAGSPRDDEDPAELPADSVLRETDRAAFLATGGDRFADAFAAWLELKLGHEELLRLCGLGSGWLAGLDQTPEAAAAEWKLWMARGRPGDPRLERRDPAAEGGG